MSDDLLQTSTMSIIKNEFRGNNNTSGCHVNFYPKKSLFLINTKINITSPIKWKNLVQLYLCTIFLSQNHIK